MTSLHRAVVQIDQQPEVHVFFLSKGGGSAGDDLLHLIDQVCQVPSHRVGVSNVLTEAEVLRDWAMGDSTTGDARLFESGFGPDGVSYFDPRRALYLLDPGTAARLYRAASTVRVGTRSAA